MGGEPVPWFGLAKDSWRHPPPHAQLDEGMSARIVELAHERRRFGYRRIADLAMRKLRGKNKLNLRQDATREARFATSAASCRRSVSSPIGGVKTIQPAEMFQTAGYGNRGQVT